MSQPDEHRTGCLHPAQLCCSFVARPLTTLDSPDQHDLILRDKTCKRQQAQGTILQCNQSHWNRSAVTQAWHILHSELEKLYPLTELTDDLAVGWLQMLPRLLHEGEEVS